MDNSASVSSCAKKNRGHESSSVTLQVGNVSEPVLDKKQVMSRAAWYWPGRKVDKEIVRI